jgi:AraC-like DNA-binding protein
MEKYTQAQKEIADRARDIVFANLERHVTIAELAQEMHVSQTQIKVCFNRVYGMPVFSYARKARMEAAAAQLEKTQDSILEIAGKYGYENGSKFATAFRSVMGVSPSQYRRRYRWEQENGIAPHMTQVEP